MKKCYIKVSKGILSAMLAVVFLSAVCLVYSYNMLGVPTVTGASGYSGVPRSLKSKMEEGFGWNIMDKNGYNNDEAYDHVDVLIMGGSHIEALQMNRSENVTNKLDKLLPDYHVYNVGTSGHTVESCANYFDSACSYFNSQYVVIDLNNLCLDEEGMTSVVRQTYLEPELLSQKSTLARVVRNYIPASGEILLQLQNWVNLAATENVDKGVEQSVYDDPEYIECLRNFLSYMGDIAKEHGTQLILLYHPMNYNVDGNGNLTFEDETDEWEIFQSFCEENGIVAVSTKDEYIRMFNENHVVPNGFSNTKLGSGHINKYGHTAMANVLYETIKNLEE